MSTSSGRYRLAEIRSGLRRYDGALERRWPRGRWAIHGVTALFAFSAVAAAVSPAGASGPGSSSSPQIAVASKVPSAQPTVAPTPTPTTSEEAASPATTPSPLKPTVAPTTESTVDPTPDPTPDPTEEPTPEPTIALTFQPISLKGSGDKVARFSIPEDALAMATIRYTGSSNFAVWTIDSSGAMSDLLVNEIGSYSGRVLFDESDHSVAFKIETRGSWAITISPIEKIPAWSGSAVRSGTGDYVLRLTGTAAESFVVMKLTHLGTSNFAVWAYGISNTDLLVNEIGRYSGEVLMNDAVLLEIHADGKWTATIE